VRTQRRTFGPSPTCDTPYAPARSSTRVPRDVRRTPHGLPRCGEADRPPSAPAATRTVRPRIDAWARSPRAWRERADPSPTSYIVRRTAPHRCSLTARSRRPRNRTQSARARAPHGTGAHSIAESGFPAIPTSVDSSRLPRRWVDFVLAAIGVLSLGLRLVHLGILYAMWRDGSAYDPAKLGAARGTRTTFAA
jgi:hypothetical protein